MFNICKLLSRLENRDLGGRAILSKIINSIPAISLILVVEAVSGQQISTEFFSNENTDEFETASLSFLPETDKSTEDFDFPVEYILTSVEQQTGEWLLEKMEPLSIEEEFAKKWFLSVLKNPADLQGKAEVLEENAFQDVSARHASGELPSEFDLELARRFSDIRLLALVRYGYQYLLFADLRPIELQEQVSGFTLNTVIVDGEHRAIGAIDNATISLLFGAVPLAVQQRLRERIGLE